MDLTQARSWGTSSDAVDQSICESRSKQAWTMRFRAAMISAQGTSG